jgi:hypothetical protein
MYTIFKRLDLMLTTLTVFGAARRARAGDIPRNMRCGRGRRRGRAAASMPGLQRPAGNRRVLAGDT